MIDRRVPAASGMWESSFLALVFLLFSALPGCPEAQFSVFSANPRARKGRFWRFLLIRGLGKSVFGDFYSSEASESLFFAFSAHPRPQKVCFWCFLQIRGLGRAIFHSAAAMKDKVACGTSIWNVLYLTCKRSSFWD